MTLKINTKKYDCIIFDCDNVLVDTESIMLSVLLDLSKDFGIRMTLDEAVMQFCGQPLTQIIKVLEARSGTTFPLDFEQRLRAIAYENFRKELQPKAGVKELLSQLKVPFCVASNGPREKIELNLGLTGLLEFFKPEHIFSAYEVKKWKPDPRLYLHAAEVMGFSPSQCVVIEDSIPGVQAAVSGGFTVYGLSHGYNTQELHNAGAIVFNDMRELVVM